MTVYELIQKLKQYPDHFEVALIGRTEDEQLEIEGVRKVKGDDCIIIR